MSVEFAVGQIADTPSDASHLVRVSVPNMTQLDRVVHGPVAFRPSVQPNGDVYFPQKGDRAIVATDTLSGEEWLVSWQSSTPHPGPVDNSNIADSDSGWISVNNTVSGNYSWNHGLAIATLDLHKVSVQGWFSPTNPVTVTGIYPLDFRSMKLDSPGTTPQGYANPAWVRLNGTAFEYGIYSVMPVFSFFDPVALGWGQFSSGFYRFMIWRNF